MLGTRQKISIQPKVGSAMSEEQTAELHLQNAKTWPISHTPNER
jgi:hypothetical protein